MSQSIDIPRSGGTPARPHQGSPGQRRADDDDDLILGSIGSFQFSTGTPGSPLLLARGVNRGDSPMCTPQNYQGDQLFQSWQRQVDHGARGGRGLVHATRPRSLARQPSFSQEGVGGAATGNRAFPDPAGLPRAPFSQPQQQQQLQRAGSLSPQSHSPPGWLPGERDVARGQPLVPGAAEAEDAGGDLLDDFMIPEDQLQWQRQPSQHSSASMGDDVDLGPFPPSDDLIQDYFGSGNQQQHDGLPR